MIPVRKQLQSMARTHRSVLTQPAELTHPGQHANLMTVDTCDVN